MFPLYTHAGPIIDTFNGYVPACAYITGACAVGCSYDLLVGR